MAKILFTLIGAQSPGTKPLNTSLLSAVLNKAGHETILFDTTFMDLGFELDTEISDRITQFKKVDFKKYNLIRDNSQDPITAFLNLISKEQPDIVCASAMSDMFWHTTRFLARMKEEHDIPVICGGIHATLQPENAISPDCIDYIVVGEGEDVIIPLIDWVLNKNPIPDRTPVPVWYKKDGSIVKTSGNQLVDLSGLPYMNYDFYDERQFMRPFEGRITRSGDVHTMRGCPKRCSYCCNAELNKIYQKMEGWTGWRTYTPERFVAEADYLVRKYDLNFFKFFDEDMLLRPEEDMAALSELYKKRVNIPFTMQAHPNSVSPTKAKLLKNMNCASITISMECGNEHYRRNILNRNYTNDKFCKAIKTLRDAGLRVTALTMIGLPYESRKMIYETIELAKRAKPSHINSNIFFPYRGTPLGDLAVKEKFADPKTIRESKFDSSRTIMHMPQISPEEIEGIRRVWNFYISWPRFMRPFFRLLEKPTPIREWILRRFQSLEYFFKRFRKSNT